MKMDCPGFIMDKAGFTYHLAPGEGTINGLADELEKFGAEQGWSVKYLYHLNLVLDEVITNTISYGYEKPDTYDIHVDMHMEGDVFRMTVTDNAAPFNPLEDSPDPELHTPLEHRRHVGGMGVHIMKKLMHKLLYERIDGKNRLTLEKDLRHCKH